MTTTKQFMTFFRMLVLAFATLALAACGGGDGKGGDATGFPSKSKLKVSPSSVSVSLDKDSGTSVPASVTFTMTDADGQPAGGTISLGMPHRMVSDGDGGEKSFRLVNTNANGNQLKIDAATGKVTLTISANVAGEGTITTTFIDSVGAKGKGPSIKVTSSVTGGADTGTPDAVAPQPTLTIPVFEDAASAPIGTFAAPITASSPAFVSVTLLDANGVAIANAAIEFELSSDVGSLSQASQLTDSTGTARVQLNAGTVQGAGTLTASYTDPADSTVTASNHASFAVQVGSGTGPTLTTPELKNGADTVGTTAKSINDDTPARVTVTLTDGGVPMANKVVTFTIVGASGVGALDPVTGTALTDGSGLASITLNAGSNEGAATLIASYNNGEATSQVDFSTKGAGVTVEQEIALGQLDTTASPAVFDNSLEAPVSLGVGSTTSISVDIVDVTATNPSGPIIYTGSPIEVTFTSACVQAGNATLSPANAISIGGHAVTTYQAINNACVEDDVQATAVVNGVPLLASTGPFAIMPSPTSTISFIEATPPTIGIKGASAAGVEEASVIKFQVKDANGNSVNQGVAVNFTLQTTVGGFKITSATSATTDANGFVNVTVTSGTVPGVGTVRASLASDSTIYGTGSVSIQQGVATQDRFVIAIEELNPPAGNHLGYTTTVTARAADRYGNWVPDGTRINFNTKLGDIEPSCDTVDGACSVTWTSQGSQPLLFDNNREGKSCSGYSSTEWYRQGLPQVPWLMGCLVSNQLGIDRFGINVITAWALGEESFSDLNGNNVFDDNEHYVDLPEAFDDNNISGLYDTVDGAFSEDYQDIVPNGQHDVADGSYNGLSCASTATQCNSGLINVRSAATMVLSTDNIQMMVFSSGVAPDLHVEHLPPLPSWGGARLMSASSATIATPLMTVVVADLNGNAPATGTEISVKVKDGSVDVTDDVVLNRKSCKLGNSLDPFSCDFGFNGLDTDMVVTFTATSGADGSIELSSSYTVP